MDGRLGFMQLMRAAIRFDPLENVIEIILADGRDVRDQRFAQLLSIIGKPGPGWSFTFTLEFTCGITQRGRLVRSILRKSRQKACQNQNSYFSDELHKPEFTFIQLWRSITKVIN